MAYSKNNHLSIMALMVLLPYGLTAYPVFGTKRYGRSTNPMHNGWGVSSVMHVPSYYFQALPHPQTHYPMNYYDSISPYAPDYTDDYYYPQEPPTYPIYYPPVSRSNSKYQVYQPALPYYYSDRHLQKPGYGYYDTVDPVDDLQDEMIQEEEREEREEALPIGQETWYETDENPDADESLDDVNAAFLQNLIMYNKAMSNNQKYVYGKQPVDAYNSPDYSDDYTNWQIENYNNPHYVSDDEEVKELKMLAGKPKKLKSKNNKQSAAQERLEMIERSNNRNHKSNNYDSNNSEAWINWNNKRTLKKNINPISNLALKKQEQDLHGSTHYASKDLSFNARKPTTGLSGKIGSTSTALPTTVSSTEKPMRDARGGQKEVVLMRPATPVRRPFSEPVMELLAQQGGPERKRTPSVYDTIKRLLEMEKNLDEKYSEREQIRPPMRKRYVTNEESLVAELAGLKKTA